MPSSDRTEPRGDHRQSAPDRGVATPGAPLAGMDGPHGNGDRQPAQFFDPTQPWDAQSAEALTRLYESDEGDLRKRLDGPRRRPLPHIETPAAGSAGEAGAPDRAWLEERLAEVARRLQDSLAELNPDKALAPLNQRLDLIEERFSQALARVAQRSDVDSLRLIEAHVLELSANLEQTRSRLDRIDTIDDQLRGIAGRLEAGNEQRLDALEQLLQDYVADWRRSEERTTSALQTLEDAVARIGDSVEGMEASKPAPDLSLSMLGAPDLGSPRVDGDPLSQVYADGARALGAARHYSILDAAEYTPRLADPPPPPPPIRPAMAGDVPPPPSAAAEPLLVEQAPPPLADALPAQPATAERLAPPALRALAIRARLRQAQVLSDEAAADRGPTGHTPRPAATREPATPATARTRPSILFTAAATLFAATGYLLVDVLMETAPGSSHPTAHVVRPADAKSVRAEPKSPPAGVDTHATGAGRRAGDRQDGPPPPAPAPAQQEAPEVEERSENEPPAAPRSVTAEGFVGAMASLFRTKAEAVAPPAATATAVVDAPATADDRPPPFVAPLPMTIGPASLRQAAMNGDAAAQFAVAARYAAGQGVDADQSQALHWYHRAAARGLAQAQFRLAAMHERGLGTTPDPERARVWYARAAAQGHVKAMHNLAVSSIGGGRSDYAAAAKWFGQAADHGLADSQFNLAVLYQGGLGVAKDLRQAYKWLSLAARAGDREAVSRAAQVKAQMTAADIEAADAMAAAWQARTPNPRANETSAGS